MVGWPVVSILRGGRMGTAVVCTGTPSGPSGLQIDPQNVLPFYEMFKETHCADGQMILEI